jgi:hypothetical protein
MVTLRRSPYDIRKLIGEAVLEQPAILNQLHISMEVNRCDRSERKDGRLGCPSKSAIPKPFLDDHAITPRDQDGTVEVPNQHTAVPGVDHADVAGVSPEPGGRPPPTRSLLPQNPAVASFTPLADLQRTGPQDSVQFARSPENAIARRHARPETLSRPPSFET